ncbi:NAD(P)-dependent dehydrogenase (short-subunit alcohol dehydrogenase family) [Microbacterium sp. ZKA21]|uniref:SDR family NAD(P)-dependent oxidoreductase n=1 Tax=Microbacterium sp. ZKA21 TaxID=3381694 RepID=UPI003D215B05
MSGRWTGKRALVTGASNGVGLEIARRLAEEGTRLILPVRSRLRGDAAARSILASVPDAEIDIRDLDLARPETVTALAMALRAEGEAVDRYVMNAGVVLLGDAERHLTEQGLELHFQANFLGHYALTQLLLPLLRRSRARIAVQLSLAASHGRLDDLQSERRYHPLRAYAASKRVLGIYAYALAQSSIAGIWGTNVQLCHPGVAPGTGIAADARKRASGATSRLVERLGSTPRQAAETALVALESDAVPGQYYVPSAVFELSGAPRERLAPKAFTNPREADRILETAENLVDAARCA